jgi:hypothetical protein
VRHEAAVERIRPATSVHYGGSLIYHLSLYTDIAGSSISTSDHVNARYPVYEGYSHEGLQLHSAKTQIKWYTEATSSIVVLTGEFGNSLHLLQTIVQCASRTTSQRYGMR